MSFCDFVPDDPSCQVVVPDPIVPDVVDPIDPIVPVIEPVDPIDPTDLVDPVTPSEPVDPMPSAGAMADIIMVDPNALLGANLAYLGVELYFTLESALRLFRYRPTSDYYDFADTLLGTNWWKIGWMIAMWFGLAMNGTLVLLHILSMLGIASDIYLMVWHLAMMFGPLVFTVPLGMLFYSYDTAYAACDDSSDANTAAGCSLQSAIEAEYTFILVESIASAFTLTMNYDNWWMAQFLNMSEEKQDEMMEENAAAEAMDDTIVKPMDDPEDDIAFA